MNDLNLLQQGFFFTAPLLLFAGIGFCLSTAASPYVATIGKAVMIPLAVIVGVVTSQPLADTFVPEWHPIPARMWFFGPGWFLVIMLTATFCAEGMLVRQGQALQFLYRQARRFIRTRRENSGRAQPTVTVERVDENAS